jgi:two-component system sensor histidine kinase VicK
LPRLFSKFASKSYQGIGLGLFVAKNIEAHNGKILAENNSNNTIEKKQLPFALPTVNRQQNVNIIDQQ